jgi:hypothetical protein
MLKPIQTAAMGLMLALASLTTLAATRSIDATGCAPVISITAGEGTASVSWAYEERIGTLTPTNISDDGVWVESERVIRWGGTLSATPPQFSYSLSGRDGTYPVSGREASDGALTQTGKALVRLSCDADAIPDQAATPVLSASSGTRAPLSVSISSSTAGATIHYTTDASTPTASSPVYSGAIAIEQATYFKAIAVKDGLSASDVVEAYYPAPQRKLFETFSQTVSGDSCNAEVSISLAPTIEAKSYGVQLRTPLGVVPTDISDGGVWDEVNAQIKWGIYEDTSARELTFKVSGPDATYSLLAEASFGGYAERPNQKLVVTQDCIPPQAIKPKLSPAKGRVPVTVAMASETEDAVIRYTLDGSLPTASSALYEGPITLEDPATLQAVAFKEGLEPSVVAKGEYLTGTRPKAIIVAGGGPYEGNALWPATVKVSQYAYNALLYQGYEKDDIFLISPVEDVDFDGDGNLDDVDALATIENLKYAITDWALNASELMVYLTDHGGFEEFVLNKFTDTPQFVSVGELDSWFDEAQAVMRGPLTFIYDACQSGTFVEGLLPPVGAERVVLTSASNEPALFLEGGALSFSYQFWAAVFYRGKFYDAYLIATQQMEGDQRPLLDANGNGIANEREDRFLVKDMVIGRGAVAAAVPPELKGVSPAQTLNGEISALIEVGEVISLNPIERVWAVMVPPNFRSRSAGEPVTELPSFELADVDGDGKFGATYSGFTKNGTYKLQLYARDNQGIVSLPVTTEVTQAQGEIIPNEVPVAEDAAYTIEEDGALEGTLKATDADGDVLTFVIVSDGEFGTVSLIDLNQGTFRYRAHANSSGSDQFTFIVNDGVADSNIATVTMTVVEKEDPPVANDARFVIDPGEIVDALLPGEDGDEDPLTFEVVSQPASGELTLKDTSTGAFTFNSDGASGTVTFDYTVSDGKATSDPGTIEIFINRGYNTQPSLNACTLTVAEDQTLTAQLSGTDAENDPLTFKLTGTPSQGVAELSDSGELIYTPKPDYVGTDAITVVINDGYDNSEPAKCEITVTPENDAPVARGTSITVADALGYTGTLEAEDIDGDDLVFEWVVAPTRGQLVWLDEALGQFKYTPDSAENGTDGFSFRVSDGKTYSEAASVSVSIRVPQAILKRSVVDEVCVAEVSIEVLPVASVTSQFILEQLPATAKPENISDEGVWDQDSKTIRWGGFLDNANRTLKYTFTSDDGDQPVSGQGSFDGWPQQIQGADFVRINCEGARVATPVITPDSGSRVPLSMEISSETEGANIFYTLDGSEPSEQATAYAGPVELTGPARVRARGYKEGLFRSQEARAKFRPANPKKAIMVLGGPIDSSNALWPSTLRVARHAYGALLYQGYDKDEIQVLAPTKELDLDGNEDFDDVDDISSNDTISDSILNWADGASELMVYMVGHGGDNRFQIALGGEYLGVENLDAWLDEYQSDSGARTIVVYDACRSGSFLADLIGPVDVERFVLTSSSEAEPAWFINQGTLSFSFQFWSAVFGKANLGEAYRQAQSLMKKYQTGLIDIDGDGLADDIGAKGADIRLGRGAVTAAFEPEIKGVSSPQDIGGSTVATLTVTGVTAVNPLERVWAVILPPGYDGSDPDLPVLSVVEFDLLPADEGAYAASYADFDQAGLYEIVFYAQDDQGLLSQPAYSQVLKGEGSFSGDTDGDGIADADDLCPAIADDQLDSDNDGKGNACDDDDDGDGASDEEDAFPLNPDEQKDTDGDGIGDREDDDDDGDLVPDSEDPAPLDASISAVAADQDGDGVSDDLDNCVFVANADQKNNDDDEVGDLCDNDDDNDGIVDTLDGDPFTPDGTNLVLETDSDDDGLKNDADNCELVANPDQLDTDEDGQGDACDSDDDNDGLTDVEEAAIGTNALLVDSDADGDSDSDDNCPLVANEDQLNTDGDVLGNVCDDDDDNDGLTDVEEEAIGTNPLEIDSDDDGASDGADNCPLTANADQQNTDGDDTGDACDADDDGDGVGDEDDEFPTDASESVDTDKDGVGDNSDAFPEDPSETIDTDGDNTGDNSDAFPLDSRWQQDSDGDQMADRWEADYGLNAQNASDRYSDVDLDGIIAIEEFIQGSDPTVADQSATRLRFEGPGNLPEGGAGDWRLLYQTGEADHSAGLGLRFHFEAEKTASISLEATSGGGGVTTVLENEADAFDFDFDEQTTQYLEINFDESSRWLAGSEIEIGVLRLSVPESLSSGTKLTVRVSASSLPASHGVSAEALRVVIQSASLDIDGDGQAQALTDGLLIIRRLFGFEGTALASGAVGGGATYTQPEELAARIDEFSEAFDIDANGKTEALTDGLLIIRRLFGFEGSSLASGAVSGNAERSEPEEIAKYIDSLKP